MMMTTMTIFMMTTMSYPGIVSVALLAELLLSLKFCPTASLLRRQNSVPSLRLDCYKERNSSGGRRQMPLPAYRYC